MSSWLAKDGTTTMVGSARCVHTADSVRCDGFAYTPSGYCVEHAPKCACGMIWPNCDCPGETLADLDLYDKHPASSGHLAEHDGIYDAKG